MVMTILEAQVSIENWAALKQAYQEASRHQDAGLMQSFLIQSTKSLDLWRILTVWESREALDAMRQSGETPRGVLIFRDAHAEPMLAVFEVVQQIIPQPSAVSTDGLV